MALVCFYTVTAVNLSEKASLATSLSKFTSNMNHTHFRLPAISHRKCQSSTGNPGSHIKLCVYFVRLAYGYSFLYIIFVGTSSQKMLDHGPEVHYLHFTCVSALICPGPTFLYSTSSFNMKQHRHYISGPMVTVQSLKYMR